MRSETFAFFAGIAYLVVGLLGLVPAALQPPPADAPALHVTAFYGYLLGVFPVNVLHSAVHVGVGIWGIVAGRSVLSPRAYARTLAVLFGLLAVLGAIPQTRTLFGVSPIHGHDVWLHAVTALLALYFGWHPAAWAERRAPEHDDRREHDVPVGKDRRSGHGDRRLPASEI